MKAIITIEHQEYLVADAKKALALVDMLQKSTRVMRVFPSGTHATTYQALTSTPVVEMKTITADTIILQTKTKK